MLVQLHLTHIPFLWAYKPASSVPHHSQISDIYHLPRFPFFSLFQSGEQQRGANPISLVRRIHLIVVYSKTQEGGGLGLKTSACPQRRMPESITVCSRVMYVICTLLGTHPTPELWSVPAPCEYQHKERLGMNTICILGLICSAAVQVLSFAGLRSFKKTCPDGRDIF